MSIYLEEDFGFNQKFKDKLNEEFEYNDLSSDDDEFLDNLLEDDYFMVGGDKVPSYDEKNYDKGIIRKCLNLNDEIKDRKFEYYYTKNNQIVKDNKLIERIENLKIPRAWEYVWISLDEKSDIQVIGKDSKGRKQYLYNKNHNKELISHKFKNLNLFVSNLQKLNNLIIKSKNESKGNPYDKHYILSTIIKIILLTGMRAGKEFYAKKSETYGVTSLRCKHCIIKNDYIVFKFKGKSNIIHEHKIIDKEIVNHIKELKKLCKNDDDKLFNYKKKGIIKKIDEFTLNNFLHKYLHPKIVIKDLRTYLVNYVLIKNILKELKDVKVTKTTSDNKMKKIIRKCVKETAEFIQHTVAVSKKNYVDPRIIKRFIEKPEYFNKHINDPPSNLLIDIIKDDIIIDEM